ncbi:MAG: bifunctional fucokinase/L-fucose-1-P-guanylyltransferase [Clostridium sp.]|nr:bifunctional fucokinase/L-fucose-1-P-guanylyltransferase [Clostridium sp.]
MENRYAKLNNLFLRQSYMDSWEEYVRGIRSKNAIHWDHVILTASNEEQAEVYRQQIAERIKNGHLPRQTEYAVLPDPQGKRVGSGGATFHVLKYIAQYREKEECAAERAAEKAGAACAEHRTKDGGALSPTDIFRGKRILVIHSGGDSKRVPQYSVCGKLFSPVPRELPDGRASTLFDEFMISMAGVAGRIPEGMLVLSGDVLLLFNPLQIDAQFHGAAAISVKENVAVGKEHGVFLNNGNDVVGRFLHKQSEEELTRLGAVNDKGCVDLDTGAVLLDAELLGALFSLISTDGVVDADKYGRFVNERARISFYGDFLYPLAEEATLDQYYLEAAEGELNDELHECRTQIWQAIHSFSMKLICLSPAKFIHFGTTGELLALVTSGVEDYEFLDWKKEVFSVCGGHVSPPQNTAMHHSVVERAGSLGNGVYVEQSYVEADAEIGHGSILSNLRIGSVHVPPGIVLHGLYLRDGGCVVRVYAAKDNPKGTLAGDAPFLGTTLKGLLRIMQTGTAALWSDRAEEACCLWNAALYPVFRTMEEAVASALFLHRAAADGACAPKEREKWLSARRLSLEESFREADTAMIPKWQKQLENEIIVRKFLYAVRKRQDYLTCLQIFGERGVSGQQLTMLLQYAQTADFSEKIRIYYHLSRGLRQGQRSVAGYDDGMLEGMCFDTIRDEIFREGRAALPESDGLNIVQEDVSVALPVRVNWGGGWTDTPPQCNEQGGVVLNAAITLNGVLPVQVRVRKMSEYYVAFESADLDARGEAHSVEEIRDCHNPYDFFALHKAALIACGIIPMEGEADLTQILRRLGGGIYLSTQVVGVPKGSGLGTSSILSGACVKGIFAFLGRELSDEAVYETVSCMEQIMSTGGGWQDQVGGLTGGIKLITTRPGLHQQIRVSYVTVPDEAKKELQERFALIYTGQRRLARNLLRDVVGNYIGGREESVEALYEMKRVAAMMRFELEEGNIDGFAALLNRHWELSKKLDAGSTNTCIEQIFLVCEDLIDGRFIAGAGGGGFIQVILKRGVTRQQLGERLREVFQDSGVAVWECAFV